MSERLIHKMNVNPFWGSLIFRAFYQGYGKPECALLYHYVILPMVLYSDLRVKLMRITKRATLSHFRYNNKLEFVDFQNRIWQQKHLTDLSLLVLANQQIVDLKQNVQIKQTFDFENYSADVKEYFRAACRLGVMLKKEPVKDVYKILNVIP